MKKCLIFIAALVLMTVCLSACGTGNKPNDAGDSVKKARIVTTIFPVYDWIRNVLGNNTGNIEVTMLLDNGVDLHSYQPTADDILRISTCDLFVFVGGESDKWVADVLKKATNKDMIVINLMDALGSRARVEEIVEGMEAGEEEDEEEGEPEYDEHIWLSLRNADILVNRIEEAIEKIDAGNAETYRRNAKAYSEKLNALDKEYREAVEGSRIRTLLFGDRFPFRYLTEDYGLDYYAAFIGCSAETEASFETIVFLSGKVDELRLHSIITIEGTDHRIAETVVRNTQNKDQKILTMDSMQSVTAVDARNGAGYLEIMKKNLSTLKEALK